MKSRHKLFYLAFIMVLCIVQSFGWMSEEDNPPVRTFGLHYLGGNLSIMPMHFDVELAVKLKDDEDFHDIPEEGQVGLYNINAFSPGESVNYRIRIINRDTVPMTLSILMSDIYCDSEYLAECIFLGSSGSAGFNELYSAPEHFFFILNSKLAPDESGAISEGQFPLFENLVIPPGTLTIKDGISVVSPNTVELYFYITFDRNANNDAQNRFFEIGGLVFEVE